MAKVILRPEILGISGKVGNMIFRTTKDGRTFVSSANRQPRSTKLKPAELARRERFVRMSQEVARRIANGDTRPRKTIWAEVKQTYNGH